MKKREVILNSIKDNIGSGKVNVIFTPKGIDGESFLLNDLSSFLKELFPNCFISFIRDNTRTYELDLFNSFVDIDRNFFILINDLSLFKDPLSIINMFYGNKKINIIATTTVNMKRLSGKNITDIRGRYINYFYPPYLYGDEIDDNNISYSSLFEKYFANYKFKSLAQKIYSKIVEDAGDILSFRTLYQVCRNETSLVTFVEIMNYLNDAGLFYLLPRVEIDDLEELEYGYAYYPTRCYDILKLSTNPNINQRIKAYYDSLIVARAFYDNQIITRAFHASRETISAERIFVKLNNCFLVKNKGETILLKTHYFDEDDISTNMFVNYKGKFQKIIVDGSDDAFYKDKKGILRCGVKYILKKGIFSYGNISKKQTN